jgi:DNA repair photolyase
VDVGTDQGAAPALPLPLLRAKQRTFDTPEFQGVTFYEVRSKSVLNQVPAASRMPFRWTVNPYRGCTHACVYCFARNTHTYLDMDAGRDFDTRIVVKVNAAEALRRDLGNPRWRREHVAMGTNVDPYQRAEGRYRLMPGIITALTDFDTPFSILSKGTLLLRDLPLLAKAAERVPVSVSTSVGFVDERLWRLVEPGTPSPRARLGMVRRLTDAGIGCSVLMAPVLPFLTDSPEQLERAVREVAEAGADSVSALVLHLRPGAREWYLSWLNRHHPELVPRYQKLYRGGSYARRAYQQEISARVRELARRHGVGALTMDRHRGVRHTATDDEAAAQPPEQLTL